MTAPTISGVCWIHGFLRLTLFALKWNPGGSGGEVVEFTGTSTGRFNLGGSLQRRCTVH
jgi:hypothetical protein